jgi:hypothetical protein
VAIVLLFLCFYPFVHEAAEDAQKAILEAGGVWYSNMGRWKNLLNTAADRQSAIRLFGAVLGLSTRAKQDVKL